MKRECPTCGRLISYSLDRRVVDPGRARDGSRVRFRPHRCEPRPARPRKRNLAADEARAAGNVTGIADEPVPSTVGPDWDRGVEDRVRAIIVGPTRAEQRDADHALDEDRARDETCRFDEADQ